MKKVFLVAMLLLITVGCANTLDTTDAYEVSGAYTEDGLYISIGYVIRIPKGDHIERILVQKERAHKVEVFKKAG
jgi:hypothetical protein